MRSKTSAAPNVAGKSNNDALKHDGRFHGNGDHNDDGHADNGKGPALAQTVDVAPAIPAVDLLLDGSFEQAKVGAKTWTHQKQVGGWKSDTEVEVWGKDFYGLKATDGDKFAELDYDKGASNIYQDVTTVEGAEYTFAFDYMKRPDSKAGSDTINVYWNGTHVGTVEPGKSAWEHAEFKVVGTGGTDRIEFREDAGDNDSYGGLIDNASLKATGKIILPEALTLATENVVDASTSDLLVGDADADQLVGGAGSDALYGLDGDDKLVGDRVGTVTVPLAIQAELLNAPDAAAVSITVSNLPDGATLSAGTVNADGSWTLKLADLADLTITARDSGDFSLKVVASATDGSGLVESSEITVALANDGRNDLLVGGKGNDVALGGAGDDVIYGGSIPTGEDKPHVPTYEDNDVLRGGAGNDVIFGNSGDDKIWGGVGNDKLSGGKGDDRLFDGKGDDAVQGNTGDDHVVAGLGDDVYEGNAGFDTLDFSRATGSMAIDMSKKSATGLGNDTFSGFERVVGSKQDDTIKGSKYDNVIDGGAGDDVIRGLGGADTLTGGEGGDTFVFTKKDAADGTADVVTDFSAEDALDLRDFFKGQKGAAESVVAIKDDGVSSHVYAKIGADMVEVAVLEGFTGHTTAELLKAGMILA
jgi:Ca2+-binding RTX toxin-like protein